MKHQRWHQLCGHYIDQLPVYILVVKTEDTQECWHNHYIRNRLAMHIVCMYNDNIHMHDTYVPQYDFTTSSLPQLPLTCLAWCLRIFMISLETFT